jgi:hypothetical protein
MRRCILVAVVLAGCKGTPDCERAVHHVMQILSDAKPSSGKPVSPPSADEQRVIDEVERVSIATCKDEGLSAPQLDCILAIETLDDMSRLGNCPAIAAHKPSWLKVPVGQP